MQLSDAPAATLPLAEQLGVGLPGRLVAFGTEQKALFAVAVPTFVQVTVQVTVAPALAGFGVQATVLVMSAVLPLGVLLMGTVVLESLLLGLPSFVALVVAGTVTGVATVGVNVTVQPSVPPGTTDPLGEQLAVGAPGRPLVSMEHVAAVAVTAPAFVQIAVQVTGEPTVPGDGVQLTVLTMSAVLGAATICTFVVPLLLPVAAAGSLLAAVVEFTVTVPAVGELNSTLQPSVAPGATSTGFAAFGQTTVAPAGNDAALLTWQVAPSAATGPMLVQVTAHETVAPTFAGLGVQATVLVMSGVLSSVTVTVLVQRAGSGATQAGSPLVTLAVLATLLVEVFVAFNVT
ncbi:MAG: hypothetical protein IT523_13995, partial [Burkholderiales bacterium]|nr:hypothetical protein [Burkholderiales bacterium]